MRDIFTYPNNLSTNYIDPAYDGDDTVGFQKRIKDLRDGNYLDWNGFDPVSVDLDEIQKGLAQYHTMYDNLNEGNLKIYDFYTFPLVTHDTTRIQNAATGSDTGNSSGATVTVTGHQFVDGDRVELSGFDETLADLNGLNKFVDSIDANTVRLFHDSELSDPVEYLAQILNTDINVLITDVPSNIQPFVGETTPIQVQLNSVTGFYDGATFDADSTSGSNVFTDRLHSGSSNPPGLSGLYLKHVSGHTFDLYQDANFTDPLTAYDYFNPDNQSFYNMSVETGFEYIGNAGKIQTGTGNNKFTFIQYLNYTGQYNNTMGAVGAEWGVPFEQSPSAKFTITNGFVDGQISGPNNAQQKYFPVIYDGLKVSQDYQVPGKGYFVKPLFGNYPLIGSGLNEIYHYNDVVNGSDTFVELVHTTGGNKYRKNNNNHPTEYITGPTQIYNQTDDEWYNSYFNFIDAQKTGTQTPLARLTVNNAPYADALPFTQTDTVYQDNGQSTQFHWFWRYDEREYKQVVYNSAVVDSGVMGDGDTSSGGGSENLVNHTAREVGIFKNTAYSGSDAILFDYCDTILTNNQKKNVFAYLGKQGALLIPYKKNTIQFATSGTNPEYEEIRCLVIPQYSTVLKSADELQQTAGFHHSSSMVQTRTKQVFPIDLFNNDLHGSTTNSGWRYDFDNERWFGDSEHAYTIGEHVHAYDDEDSTVAVFDADNNASGDSFFITITASTDAVEEGTSTAHSKQPWETFVNGSIVEINSTDYMLLLKSVTNTQKEFWVLPTQTSGGRIFPDPDSTNYYETLTNANKTGIKTTYSNIFEQNLNSNTYWSQYTQGTNAGKKYALTKSVRYREIHNRTNIGTADVASGETVTNSTTGLIKLNSTSGHNDKVTNFQLLLPGNQTYLQQTGASTFVNNAELGDQYWTQVASSATNWTGNYDTIPTFSFTTNNDGYLTGASVTNTGRIASGSRALTIDTVADTYSAPALSTEAAEDVFDVDAEWDNTQFSISKTFPHSVTPQDITVRVVSPSATTMSQNGTKYARTAGYSKYSIDVVYPPMTAEQFLDYNGFINALNGQKHPFYFNIKQNNTQLFGRKGNNYNVAGTRLKEDVTAGDVTILLEGFASNQTDAIQRGELLIYGGAHGNIITAASSTDANIYGEAKFRVSTPLPNNASIGNQLYNDPHHIIVTLDSDTVEVSRDTAGFYYLSLSFTADQFK